MAYQTRQRDPLLDDQTQAALVRRGQELVGVVLLGLGAVLTAMLVSYAPEDPNWMAATDALPQNLMGRTGATVAAIAMMIVGYGALILPVACFAWGLRFVLHLGEHRALGRLMFLPIVLALASIYAASHVPAEDWTHSFGLGGLFGDTVLGAVLNALPMPPQAGLKLVAGLAFVAGLGLMLYVIGTSRAEMRAALRFLILGLLASGAMLSTSLRGLGRGAGQVASQLRDARAARRADGGFAMGAPAEDAPRGYAERRAPHSDDPHDAVAARPEAEPPLRRSAGLLSRMPLLRPREPEPEDLEPELPERVPQAASEIEAPDEDRIRARISDVIRNRVRRPSPVTAAAQRRLQAGPAVAASPALRAEPPLTASHATAPDPGLVDDNGLDDINLFHDESAAPAAPAKSAAPTELQRRVVQHAMKRQATPSRRAVAEAQPTLPLQPQAEVFEYPPLTLLTNPDTIQRHHLSDEALEENARMLETVLDDYGVKGEIVSVRPGPVVTMYELEPAPGLKASRVIGLADDIARSMSALSARVSTVPGRSVIGIELPNQHREKVVLREILASREFGDGTQKLPLALGKDIGGEPIVANLAKMPHLLIAGTTGSGKSVAINTMILSLLYKLPPEDCRMIMIDPKMLELSVYDGIPHLLSPVVTDPKKAVVALKWVVAEMEERYRKMSKMGVRNIDGYNGRVADALSKGEMFSRTVQTGFDDDTGDPIFETEEFAPEKMPYIVVIVDEMADLMMVAGKEIEACIQRLAQMARASGIHLVMATQRPSVDVITGTIKANFPTRISFHVTSKVDSRTILGEQGAEQLLGMGDMLYMAGGSKITRVHGPFVSDEEVEEIVRHLKSFGPPDYAASVLDGPDEDRESDIDAVLGLNTGGNTNGEDALYDQAVAIVIKDRKCSTSYIQRKLGIGYNKAARLVEQMEEQGLVSAANHVGKREILVPEQE
ncbi:Cell division protein FtsK [Roseibacterium elongatum DSM 19469]|uniref:DNA translocase FtsK n=1 Tax=Roseicyclus elongatus DSM 19469 TaxID=1294273 RepID=W8RPZ6_9RHOB|nr:DNA translocase FtsK [Roseibacterium elongatum]AHM03249.1 Cell division protein FtsK [Roseibacterium elongatum DSM 19469]